ncbi:MAG: VRR-NUC domain-containing protein [Bacteroidales bacterium]|nr:VRR-NUC domain-containing protein [Bacteroidales bacterium]
MKPKPPLESEIQRNIVRRYEREGYIVVKITLCNKSGFPDLMLLRDGVASFVEVKRPGQKPRPLQRYRMDELRKAGFAVQVLTE